MDKREARKLVRELSDVDLVLLVQQAKEEKEHRRQMSLSRYCREVEQLWAALVQRVKELDALEVAITASVESESQGDRYISVTDLLRDDSLMVTWHASSVYKSGD